MNSDTLWFDYLPVIDVVCSKSSIIRQGSGPKEWRLREQTDNRTGVLQISHCVMRNTNKIHYYITYCWLGERRRYSDSLRAGRSVNRITVGARFSASVQTDPGAHPASYPRGTMSFLVAKRQGRCVDHPPPPSVEIKERVKLYLYLSSGSSWPVLGWALPILHTTVYAITYEQNITRKDSRKTVLYTLHTVWSGMHAPLLLHLPHAVVRHHYRWE